MEEKVITLATPVFFLLILIELLIGLRRRRNTYRANDAINSLSLGVLSQITGVFMRLIRIGIYAWLLQHIALIELPADKAWVWISGLLLYDFCYYWQHRMNHEVNVLWAAHVVHHQSEDYNLSTALRQPSTYEIFNWIFYIPMALLGYPLEVFVAVALVDLLYQFWVHTQQIGRLGWFDRVFVSPSNHRVHHAVNDVYLDKNYGGILILWDRLFGSFIEERDAEPVVYGTRSPLRSWNPLWANLEVYKSIWMDAWHALRPADKLRIWLARPGWRPSDVVTRRPKAPFDIKRSRFDPQMSCAAQIYCLLQLGIVLLVTTHFLAVYPAMPMPYGMAYAAWLVTGLWAIGSLMEGRASHVRFETLRLLAPLIGVALGGGWFGAVSLPLTAQLGIATIAIGSLAAAWIIFKSPVAAHPSSSAQ